MCQIFSDGLSHELGMSQETIDGLFPRLDDLLDIHMTFLDRLTCAQNLTTDKYVDNIGALLVQQVNMTQHITTLASC